MKQLNQQCNQLLNFFNITTKNSNINIQSKFGISISKAQHYRNKKSELNIIKKNNNYYTDNLTIIWIDNFSRVLKQSRIRNDREPFKLNLWSVIGEMKILKPINNNMIYNNPILPLPLPHGLLSQMEHIFTERLSEINIFYENSNTVFHNVSWLPIRLIKYPKESYVIIYIYFYLFIFLF